MISSPIAVHAASIPPRPSPVASDAAPSRGKPAAAALPQPLDVKAMRKEMASRRLQGVQERMRTLSLMMKIDSRAALRLAADLAKELKGAVKDYQAAGGRNVSAGDMALIRKQAVEAREAQARSETDRSAAEGAEDPASEPVPPTGVDGDADVRRARQAYAAAQAETAQQAVDRWDGIERAATADMGFFDRVKQLLGGLRKARDEIRANAGLSLHKPTEDDWKEADEAQAEVEREVATAAGGVGGGPTSVTV